MTGSYMFGILFYFFSYGMIWESNMEVGEFYGVWWVYGMGVWLSMGGGGWLVS